MQLISFLLVGEDMWKWVCSDVANGQSDTTRVYSDVANGQSDTITRTESLVNCDNVLNSDIDSGTSPVKKTKISANNSDLSS